MKRMARIPNLLVIVALFFAVSVYYRSDDVKSTDVVSANPDPQAIPLEPTSFSDGEDYEAAHFGELFCEYKWMSRLYLLSPFLTFSQISSLKQGQPVLRC